jgi:hypothetical protein
MSRRILMGSLIVALSLAAMSAQAQDSLPFRATFSGTFVPTPLDLSGDGTPSDLNLLEGKSNFGQFSLHVLSKSVRGPEAICPNGQPGFSIRLLAGSSVFRFRHSGDLLFVRATSETTCFDPSIGVSFFHTATGEIFGGTGKFANATGTIEGEGTAQVLLADQAGNAFGAQHGTFTGTIILPPHTGQNRDDN